MREAGLLADGREQVHRHDVHEIEQQDPAEDGERQRRDDLAGAVESVAHLCIDEFHHGLDEVLEFARYARRGIACGKVEGHYEQQAEQHREEDAVDIDHPETFAVLKIAQVVNDVFTARLGVIGGVFGF
jgi:hypothetical protein